MDPQSSSSVAIGERVRRSWSPPGRPTINTTTSLTHTATPLETSPHPSSVSGLSHSSPSLKQSPLIPSAQPKLVPFMLQHPTPAAHADLAAQHAVSSSFPTNEWGNVFSAPLDPSTFAALAASGVLGPPSTGRTSISNRSHRTPHDIPPNMRPAPLNTKDIARTIPGQPTQGVPSQWPGMTSSYPSPPSTSQRASPSHLRSGSGGNPYAKRKPTVNNMQPYMNMRPSNSSASLDVGDFDSHRLQGAGDVARTRCWLLR